MHRGRLIMLSFGLFGRPSIGGEVKANPEIIKLWAGRDKCFMCKHRFVEPLILPVDRPQRGKFQPRYNSEFLFHLYDTHGLPPEIVGDWVMGSIYGLELTEMGVRLEEK